MGVNRTELGQDTTKRADQRKEKEAMEDVGGFYLGSRLRRAASDNGHPASDELQNENHEPTHESMAGCGGYSLFADGGAVRSGNPKSTRARPNKGRRPVKLRAMRGER